MGGRHLLAAMLAIAACSREPERITKPDRRAAPRPAPAAIPAYLQGRWAVAARDCDPVRGDARGLLTIGGDAFAFGATPFTVDRVIVRPGRIAFDTSDTVESVAENRRYKFRLSGDRRQLTRDDSGLPNQVYTRCPDQPS